MNRHPGGEEQTIHLLKSIELKKGMKALDLGAGEGETVRGVDIRLQTFGVVLHDLLFLILGHNTALGERIEVGAGDHNRRPQGKYPSFVAEGLPV